MSKLDLFKAWAPEMRNEPGMNMRTADAHGSFKVRMLTPPRPGLVWNQASHRWTSQGEAAIMLTQEQRDLANIVAGKTVGTLKEGAEKFVVLFRERDKKDYAKAFQEKIDKIFVNAKSITIEELKQSLRRLIDSNKVQLRNARANSDNTKIEKEHTPETDAEDEEIRNRMNYNIAKLPKAQQTLYGRETPNAQLFHRVKGEMRRETEKHGTYKIHPNHPNPLHPEY
jgi:hypothetical protein